MTVLQSFFVKILTDKVYSDKIIQGVRIMIEKKNKNKSSTISWRTTSETMRDETLVGEADFVWRDAKHMQIKQVRLKNDTYVKAFYYVTIAYKVFKDEKLEENMYDSNSLNNMIGCVVKRFGNKVFDKTFLLRELAKLDVDIEDIVVEDISVRYRTIVKGNEYFTEPKVIYHIGGEDSLEIISDDGIIVT